MPVTVTQWLSSTTADLRRAGIDTARLDALVLLEDHLGINRALLLAHPEQELSAAAVKLLHAQISVRSRHIPLAYVRGKTEFYGRSFVITEAVLEPRPESETMIDQLKALAGGQQSKALPEARYSVNQKLLLKRKPIRIADVGAGSGAIGITAQLEVPNVSVDLLEIDKRAREIAKINVINHTTSISVIRSDLLEQSAKDYDVLLCNLPYIPDDFTINTAASHEPKIAIFGGPDGLDFYRRLFKSLQYLQHKPLYILTESLPTQQQELTKIAEKHSYIEALVDDFIQVFVVSS